MGAILFTAEALRDMAVVKIKAGSLPVEFSGHSHGGRGSGEHCSLCDAILEKTKLEYEIDWVQGQKTRVLRFHLECFQAWICVIELPLTEGANGGSNSPAG